LLRLDSASRETARSVSCGQILGEECIKKCSFLKKRTKKLFPLGSACGTARAEAVFLQKK
jgi:hypothetical protein